MDPDIAASFTMLARPLEAIDAALRLDDWLAFCDKGSALASQLTAMWQWFAPPQPDG